MNPYDPWDYSDEAKVKKLTEEEDERQARAAKYLGWLKKPRADDNDAVDAAVYAYSQMGKLQGRARKPMLEVEEVIL